ncbi:class I SAM-dependent methyltransferase [Mycolicibacterium helvum]|nr:class I SAM-dependent methyltransferase [Mycolicibacterium helvum]
MTKNRPHSVVGRWGNDHDYLPAAGHDRLLPAYDLLTWVLGAGPIYDQLIAQASLFDGARVLEVGCGTGNVAIRAIRAVPAAEVTALDPDPRALNRARRKAGDRPGVHFEQGYAQQLRYAEGAFDRVLSSMMLHHLDHDVKAAALAEAFRVLKPGGEIHVVDVVHTHGRVHTTAGEVPELIRLSGFHCSVTGARRLRFVGQVQYCCGVKPADNSSGPVQS